MRQNNLSSEKIHALLSALVMRTIKFKTVSLRIRYALVCLSVLLVFSVPCYIQVDITGALVSHITPSFSETAGSRKVSAGWSLKPRVPSSLIARFITLRIRAYSPYPLSSPHPLILSTPVLFSAAAWYDDGSLLLDEIDRPLRSKLEFAPLWKTITSEEYVGSNGRAEKRMFLDVRTASTGVST